MTNLEKLTKIFDVRWPNFKPEEVLSPDGLLMVQNHQVFPVQFSAMDRLQSFREHLDKPFTINVGVFQRRGWRSVKENFDVNRYDFSFHVAGCAFDLSVDGMSIDQLAEEAERFGYTGIGKYYTWVHIDTRNIIDKPIIWDRRKRV